MKKYEVKKISNDEYSLIVENGETLSFKKTIGFVQELQKINVNAKMQMKVDMKSKGLTPDDFCTKKIVDGQSVEDWTEFEELKKDYFDAAQTEIGLKMFELLFGKNYFEIQTILELETEQEQALFMADITKMLGGETVKTPS